MDQTTKGVASPADIARLVGCLDSNVVDDLVRTGVTVDELVEAVSTIESELAFDDFRGRPSSPRIEEIRTLLGPLFREPHIDRGRD